MWMCVGRLSVTRREAAAAHRMAGYYCIAQAVQCVSERAMHVAARLAQSSKGEQSERRASERAKRSSTGWWLSD